MPTQSRAVPSVQQVLPTFKELVRAEDVRALVKASNKRFYERLYTPLIVVWCFIFQRLNADHGLDAVVSHVSSGAVDHLDDRHPVPVSERIKSENTAAISSGSRKCRLAVARMRCASPTVLPVWMQSRMSWASVSAAFR